MLLKQINHSLGIKELLNDDYEVEIVGNFLLIHSVPYLNAKKELVYGTLVSNVSTPKPNTHVAYFIGEKPCDINGTPMNQLINNSQRQDLGNGILVDHLFSHKPNPMYPTYYEKMKTYVNILSGQAQHYFPEVTARTGRVIESPQSDSVLHYSDTNSSRAEIDAINEKLSGLKIGIIGLGGTGSYILDKVAKTLVGEIHLFDGDKYKQHNAFRAPGAATKERIDINTFKVEYFKEVYSQMHKHIIPHPIYINETNMSLLNDLDFVFIAIDVGQIKKKIFSKLEAIDIPFIDCGLGVEREGNELMGIVRTTLSTPDKRAHVYDGLVSFSDGENDDYKTNIQIADLNDLNAVFAVIKWKKYYGFFNDQRLELNSSYSVNVNTIFNNEA
ncbi:ThiF family adenylyltransferase [Flagellimonas myxillae]|uniref:ThiF family adenylyltransferase n=1 Tax=Flagellimonas myxillae TaxID=2942214 RepID=UPI00201F5FD8|nr:ThiF family adenylyltransferase [Muricauda myxillae]MCL6266585.1 ThiF family adenylyltransferase [Muricauda myxillae]